MNHRSTVRSGQPAPSRLLSLAAALALSAAGAALAAPAAPPSPGLLDAMGRDLGLTPTQARDRLVREAQLGDLAGFYRAFLAEGYAGDWLETGSDGRLALVVAVAGGDARRARHDGVRIVEVGRSLAQLEAMVADLDRSHRGAVLRRPREPVLAGWHIDVERNQVVVDYLRGHLDSAIDLVAASGVPADGVHLQAVEAMPQPAFQVIGGLRYNMASGGWCSIGFSARRSGQDGFVTAGHCGQVGTATIGHNGAAQGIFDWSVFPGADSAFVRITNGAWSLLPQVATAGSPMAVAGQTPAPVNAAICRSGARTGWRCGTVTGLNQTVNYPQGTVYGLTRASACVGQGDSGGSFITPAGQAQGVTSGGQLGADGTNCAFATPVTFFQPLQSLLSAAGAVLVTGSGGAGNPPVITGFACPDPFNSGSLTYMCNVQFTSDSPVQVQWQSSHGQPSQGDWHWGRCTRFATVSVSVTVSNDAGQATRSASFPCPTNPIP